MECKVKGCTKPIRVKSQQLCNMHYQRLNRYYGDVKTSLPCRYERNEYISNSGYAMIKINGKWMLKHRHIMEKELGRPLHSYQEQVHHIDGNVLNNSPDNLKIMTVNSHSYNHSSRQKMDYARKFKKPKYDGCKIAGCSKPHEARGYCKRHYQNLRRKNHFRTSRNLRQI